MYVHLYVCLCVHVCRPKEVVVPKEEPIARETVSALQEWCASMKELFEVCTVYTHRYVAYPLCTQCMLT